MNKGIKKTLRLLLITLILVLSTAPPAYADPLGSPKYPNRPNVAWNVSLIEVVTVHILNTTPFDMVLDGNLTDFKDYYTADSADPQHKGTSASPTAFTPSGIPNKIPAKSGASFVVSWLDTYSSKGSTFNADNVYPDRNVAYTMKQVASNSTDCSISTGDVTIHLDFNRVKNAQPSLKADILKMVVNGAAFVLEAAEFVAEPNPLAAVGFLLSAYEISSSAAEIEKRDGSTDQSYFSAYVLPKGNNMAANFPATYAPPQNAYTSNDQATPYDGLYSQHGTSQGCPQAYIIPAVVVQRETGPSQGSLSGHLPVVFVTLATARDWNSAMDSQVQVTSQASPAGYKIAQHLQREGKNGHVAFIKIARTLNHNESTLFDDAYKAIEGKKPLSREQEALLGLFAEALEKHETKLPTPKNPAVHVTK